MSALTVGSSIVAQVKNVIVHGPEICDRIYHDIHAKLSIPVIFIVVAVFTVISDSVCSVGGVLSIL